MSQPPDAGFSQDPAEHKAPHEPWTIADITRPVRTTIGEYDHVAAAAYLMKHAGQTALVVLGGRDEAGPAGIITETDIAWAVADGKDPNDIRVHDLITTHRIAIPMATSIRDAARIMTAGGFRHLPVASDTQLIGIVDIVDVCGALLGPPEE